MSLEIKNIGLLNSVKNENYINILKNENIELDNKLKKVNELVSKLKLQITENEQEKNLLISTSYKKDKDLETIKKQLEKTKSQVDELKNKNMNKISLLVDENNILQKNKELNANTIAELQQKITELEFKLKVSASSKINKRFSILSGTHNFSLSIQGLQKKQNEGAGILPELIDIQKSDNKNGGGDDLFLTGRNELIEMKENNQKLKEQLEILQNEINKNENDKIIMIKKLEKYSKEKNNLLNILNAKNEEINGKLNKENELNNNLMKQLIENKKIKQNLDNIKIKCNNLEKSKKELEDVILQQENKVNELSSSVQNVINIVKIKNIEINNNKIYITNLEETIKDLNKEFHQLRLKKKKENNQEISNLKNQLDNIKKEYKRLIDYNNNVGNRQLFNYNHISNNHIISRNYNINNFNNNGNKKIKIRMCVKNPNNNRLSYSSLNISNIVNINEHKGKRVNSQKSIRNQIINYNNDLLSKNYFSSSKKNSENSNSNNYHNIKRKNIKIKKLGYIRNNSNLNINKVKRIKNISQKNISYNNIKGYKLRDKKIVKNEIENHSRKIKNINSHDFKYKFSDNKNKDNIDNDIKDRDSNFIYKPSNLFIKQIGFEQNEKMEKQKIEEFKNLLEQIVNDIEK